MGCIAEPKCVDVALNSKPHYEILDGLRGVAALVVLAFHVGEGYTLDQFNPDKIFNHGYLAVDFFFVLSGFVIGYAYDDRWGGRMNLVAFFRRRLVRLHPMVIFGMVLGALLFYFGDSSTFPLVHDCPVWKMLLYMLLGMLLIPTPPSMDIRGWQEMHTLDAPCWSLFFEYIANILYALVIRRFSKIALGILVALSGCATLYLTLTRGDVVGGWSFEPTQLAIGFTRLMYPFFAGLLLYRIGHLGNVRKAFLWCTLLILVVLAIPRIGDKDTVWMNGIYESFIILIVFPIIVWMGASSKVDSRIGAKICKFMGDISYPVYIVNYPIIYAWTAWVDNGNYTAAQTWWSAVAVFIFTVGLSYAAMKLYDEPVRRWLGKRKKCVSLSR